MPRFHLLVAILVTVATLGIAPSTSAHYNPTKGRWMERDPLGYSDGINLYEALASSPITQLDPKGLACQRANEYGIRHESCDKDPILQCVGSAPFDRALTRYRVDCPTRSLTIYCLKSDDSRNPGFQCQSRTIRLHQKGRMGQREVDCETLAHELLHAADDCANRSGCNSTGGSLCEHVLCTEARAAAYVDCCNSVYEDAGESWEQCVDRRRDLYIKHYRTRHGCDKLTVDQMKAAWNRCVRDLTKKKACGGTTIPAIPMPNQIPPTPSPTGI